MATIYIEGNKYQVNTSDNLLQACLSIGLDIPFFCWHPELGSIGACRVCAVKKYQKIDSIHGLLVMSCMTQAIDGTIISINDLEAKNFRKSIIELMMINHPHDCPVCEEGGNCHLQDMTVMTGQNLRRYRFTKRTHINQYLGPFINHEMNRCITCYRCTRYYNEYAGGYDFGVYSTHDNVYFGRQEDGILESEFAGNLIDICPTGVFTDKIHSIRYNRKWDMQFAPSICLQCSIGCNTSPGERYGELRRIENRYNDNINHYFLCDLGRFGYGYVNNKNRPRKPLEKIDNNFLIINQDQAIQKTVKILNKSKKIIGIGSARASIESNFALRELVGEFNFYTGISAIEQSQLKLIINILNHGGIYTPSLREVENYDAILILGEDLTQTSARFALSVRQAIKNMVAKDLATKNNIPTWHTTAVMNVTQNMKNALFITNVDQTKLSDIASWNYYAPIEDQARIGFAIAHALDNQAPKVTNLDQCLLDKIAIVTDALSKAKKPLIISGTHSNSTALISAAANIARALKNRGSDVGISFITAEANSIGIALMDGGSLDDAIIQLKNKEADSVIVLENDLYRHAISKDIDEAINTVKNLILVDYLCTDIQKKANIVLSAATFAESNGTVINYEGRAQRFFKVYEPTYYDNNLVILDSWRWFNKLSTVFKNSNINCKTLDNIINDIVISLPQFSGIEKIVPHANKKFFGQKLARSPKSYSGRTAMLANINIHEPRIPQDLDTMFTFSMEGNSNPQVQSQQIAFISYPGWNSSQAWTKFQKQIFDNSEIKLFKVNDSKLNWFKDIPESFCQRIKNDTDRFIAPYWHLFGSEETSQHSLVIQKVMLSPYVMISKSDAIRFAIDKDTMLNFNCGNQNFCLPVQCSNILSHGQIGLPIGFPGIPSILIGLKVQNLKKLITKL